MAKKKPPETETPFSLEKQLAEIRSIVETLQEGTADFDAQMDMFKRGQKLITDCQAYLDKAELDIQQLVDGDLKPLSD